MNTLDTPMLRSILSRLFAEAKSADAPIRAQLQSFSPDERQRFMSQARTDYRSFYQQAHALYLPVSQATGRLLYFLARAGRARGIVEFGTSFGLSTLHLAAALKDNGGGRLIGSELFPEKAAQARRNLTDAGLAELVEIREGDALDTLSRDLPASIDLVLLDGAKVLYPDLLRLLEPRLAEGAMIVADNADDSPEYLAHIRNAENGYVSLPFGDDVEVSLRAGECAATR